MPRPPLDKYASRRRKPVRWGGCDTYYEVWYACEKCGKENYDEGEYVGGICAECGTLCGECCMPRRSPICGPCFRKREERGQFRPVFSVGRFATDAEMKAVAEADERGRKAAAKSRRRR